MLIALLLAAAPIGTGTPDAAAVALGERLARTGTLASLLPLIAAKETDEMIAAHPELSATEQGELRRTAAATLTTASDRLFAAEGRRYAELLTPADLAELIAAAERPAARRMRAVQPQVITAAMAVMGGVDYKRDTLAAFCARTGKACAR